MRKYHEKIRAEGVPLDRAEAGNSSADGLAGEQALAALETGQFDIVLMDVEMPEMDGVKATTLIRERELGRRTPIIALTAKAMQDDRRRCLAAGANDYLAKPVETERLLALLRLWLYR